MFPSSKPFGKMYLFWCVAWTLFSIFKFFATTTTSLSPWENLHILMKWAHVSCQYEQQCQLLTKALFFLNLKSDQITPPSFHVHRCIHPRFKLPLRILQSVNMWVEYRNSTFYYSTTLSVNESQPFLCKVPQFQKLKSNWLVNLNLFCHYATTDKRTEDCSKC